MEEGGAMEEITEEPVQVVARVCAIDIGKAGLVACVRVPHPSRPDRRVQEVREYATVTPALLALADWLRVERVELVAMEATSDYWKRCSTCWRPRVSPDALDGHDGDSCRGHAGGSRRPRRSVWRGLQVLELSR
jgi:hypothetical protein